jgi:DNA-binding transcriptional LysR family regulator
MGAIRMQVTDRIGRRLKLRDLNVFLAVANERSMSKAAAQLGVTQPAVSKAIADMENTFGAPLLDRGPRGVEPTLYGRALIRRSVAVFDELRQSVTDIEFLLDPEVGEARIGATEPLSAGIVPTVVETLTRQYPRISFELRIEGLPLLLRELRDRNIELAIGRKLSPISDEQLESEVLFDDRLVVVAGSQNKWARRPRINIDELLDEPWLLPLRNTDAAALVADAFRLAKVEMPRAAVASFGMSMCMRLLASGRFLALLPESTMRFSVEQLPLKILPVHLQVTPRPVVIVTVKNRTLSPVAKLFVECVREITRPLAKIRQSSI